MQQKQIEGCVQRVTSSPASQRLNTSSEKHQMLKNKGGMPRETVMSCLQPNKFQDSCSQSSNNKAR